MKKALGILIIVLLSSICVSVFSSCGEECSDGLNFVLMEDGTYGVRCGSVEGSRIVIPSKRYGIPVTKVLDKFFTDKHVEYTGIELYLPEGLTEICNEAFMGVAALGRVYVSSTVVRIGSDAFKESGLTEIVFSEGAQLSYIGASAFKGCRLTEFTAPSQLTSIGREPFAECSELSFIDLSRASQLLHLPTCFAMNSAIKEIRLNSGLEVIGERAFKGSSLIGISVPESVKRIDYGAFALCNRLKKVDIPVNGSLEEIFENAFQDCNGLRSFTLPNNLTYLKANAFYGCNALWELYDLTRDGLEEWRGSEYLGVGGLGIMAIHDSQDSESIFSVTDDGFTYMKTDAGYTLTGYVGDGVEIRLPEKLCGDTYSIAQYAFYGSTVTAVVIPEGVTGIEACAFLNSSIESINIPVSVATIGKNAFLGLKATITVEGETNWYEFIGKGVTVHFYDISKELVIDEDAEWERTLKSGWY